MKSAIQSLLTVVLLTGLILNPVRGQNTPPAPETPVLPAAPEPPTPTVPPVAATDPDDSAKPAPPVKSKSSKKKTRRTVQTTHQGGFPVRVSNDEDGNRVIVGDSAEVGPGETVRDFVVVLGDGTVNGTVEGDLVVVLGNAHVNGKVHGNAVNVGGGLFLGPNAVVEGDAVGVLGGVSMEDGAKVVGQIVPVAIPGFAHFNSERITRWFAECVILARPLSLHVGWIWWIWFGFIGIYLLLTLLFPKAVEATADVYAERTASSFLMGILALPLILILIALLLATVVGALVVPFFLAAILAGEIIGKAALLFQLGRLVGRSTGRSFVPLASVLVGAILMTLLYLVPFFGLLVNTVTNFWALGAASLALTARFRRESPKPAPDSGRPPGFPTPGPGPVPSRPSAPSGTPGIIAAPALLAVTTVLPSVTHSTEQAPPVDAAAPFPMPTPDSVPITSSPLPDPSAPATPEPARPIPNFVPPSSAAPAPAAPPGPPEALTLPRAGFGRRFLASVIDWSVLPFSSFILLEALLHFHGSPFPLVWIFFAAYFAGFYVWKNTTLGGLILGLKVVRLDGRRIDYPCAIVRTLGTVLSVLIGGIGWFSCIWDKERQAWHDKLAGTVVVRVEKMPPLV